MKKTLMQRLVAAVLFSLLFTLPAGAANDEATAQAIMAAEEFLLLLDTVQYVRSWDGEASFFKSQVPRDTWIKQISSLRPALGKVITRLILDARHVTKLPGAPDGQYVVIQYNTNFENKREAVETVTPMLDKDGKWRVSGYYIQ
ncbi:MAG: DUF4019 domain-containing protein [Desulfobulbaceae bacterium]|nr:DUF4019 domain-containing protein [Desulfobulbaceae bacterium]